jgi:uroporphyrinogen-III synthase
MTRPVAVLRPEPGNARTRARLAEAGLAAIAMPLFEVVALDWTAPDPAGFDALLLTSANAVRHAGPQLAHLVSLPVFAVGAATADAARAAGFRVALQGRENAAALVAEVAGLGVRRALHLAGRDRSIEAVGPVAQVIAVYASDPIPLSGEAAAALDGAVALVHSARAGRRLADILGPARARTALAAISEAALAAAGADWEAAEVAATPDDRALIAVARRLTGGTHAGIRAP